MSDATTKPRVLLSILKCACFEHLSDTDSLFTAISAGFGRYECERLLKPKGVELLNLPLSSTIEIGVLRRDRATQQKQLLYHSLVPLSALHPQFFTASRGETPNPTEPQVWENWLGLFSSDVALQTQSPERLFQRCIEMGSSSSRFPRLMLRLQYLPAGVPRPPQQPSTSAARSQEATVSSKLVTPSDSRRPADLMQESGRWVSQGLTMNAAGADGADQSWGVNDPTISGGAHSTLNLGTDGRLLPMREEASTTMPYSNVPPTALPPTAVPPTAGREPSTRSKLSGSASKENIHGGSVSLVVPSSERGGPAAAGYPATAAGQLENRPPDSVLDAPTATQNAPDWREKWEKYEELSKQFAHSQASWDEKRAELEAALKEAEKGTFPRPQTAQAAGSPSMSALATSTGGAAEGTQHAGGNLSYGSSLATTASDGREDSRLLHKLATNNKQIAELQKQVKDLEQENLRLHEQEMRRESAELDFFQQSVPFLERLMGALPKRPAAREAASATESASVLFAEIIVALSDAASSNKAGAGAGGNAEDSSSSPMVNLIEDALSHAIDGGEASFEDWLISQQESDANARTRLGQAGRLINFCRRAASLRSGASKAQLEDSEKSVSASSPPQSLIRPLYTPVKTDPVDCLLAANLLRLGDEMPSVEFVRLESGLYQCGREGVRIRCNIDRGKVLVHPLGDGSCSEAADVRWPGGAPGATELSTFLAEQVLVS
eukprot:gnl/TRDRNA2_/TRDRNA2_187623_c0_seq1.p1 gnl/TRDRNA2_/TRDRNA2_187623_c0~~gnl/TRDRNA2_/TRDRNA2_187623_c0_seq1.p1  ORF type:complete len:723 (+),score=143.65 gnl/TRDRNA2_/TRDRNA2_187623_c0_seq1:68-2236(+)